MVISITLWILASICNSIMDRSTYTWHSSIFTKFKNPFFDKDGWKNKYINRDPINGRKKLIGNINYPVQLTDIFHFSKMLMVTFICFSIIFYIPIIDYKWDLLIYGLTWNLIFNIFYNYILKNAK